MNKPVPYVSFHNPEISDFLIAVEKNISNKCTKGEKLRNIMFFLYSENISLDEELKRKLKECFFEVSSKELSEINKKKIKILKKLGRNKKRKNNIINVSSQEKKNAIKIFYDEGVLYVS